MNVLSQSEHLILTTFSEVVEGPGSTFTVGMEEDKFAEDLSGIGGDNLDRSLTKERIFVF